MSACGVCKEKVDRNDQKKLKCGMCSDYYHVECLKMTSVEFDYVKSNNIIWKCVICVNSRKSISSSATSKTKPISQKQTASTLINNDSKNNTANCTLEEINNNILKINESIAGLESKFFTEITRVEKNLIDKITVLTEENVNLKSEIESLKLHVENIEQKSLKNCVDIVGLPVIKDINILRNTVCDVFCNQMNVTLNKENIVDCYQKKIRSSNSSEAKIDNVVCVEFNSNIIKKNVIKAKTKLKNKEIEINIDDVNIVKVKCFVNHSLTAHKRFIYKKAINVKNDFNVLFLWIQNGNNLMRKERDSKIIIINDISDLETFKNS